VVKEMGTHGSGSRAAAVEETAACSPARSRTGWRDSWRPQSGPTQGPFPGGMSARCDHRKQPQRLRGAKNPFCQAGQPAAGDQLHAEPGHQGQQHRDGTSRYPRPQAPRHRRPAPPGPRRPGHHAGTPGRSADHVRHWKAGAGMLGVRRNEHACHRPGHQDQPARHACRPQRQTGRDNTGAHHHERQRHHPPVGSTHRGERADRLGNGVERARLQARGNAPPGNRQHRSRGRRNHSPPRHSLHGLHRSWWHQTSTDDGPS
jgi:hypothetical protein